MFLQSCTILLILTCKINEKRHICKHRMFITKMHGPTFVSGFQSTPIYIADKALFIDFVELRVTLLSERSEGVNYNTCNYVQ